MKELNCHGFDLIITLKSIKSLEFYGPRFSYFNTLEVAFEVHEKFGRLCRKTVNIDKGKTNP
jgi:hypothetical protein